MANQYTGVTTNAPIVAIPLAFMDVYSMDILHEAQGTMRYEEFAVRKEELMSSPGQVVKFTTYAELEGGGPLQEHLPMETTSLANSEKSITIGEFGNAAGVTEFALRTAAHDLMQITAKKLGRNYARTRDRYLRETLVAGGSVLFTNPAAVANVGVTAADTFDIETIRLVIEALQTENAPKFYDDYYVCFIHPHQAAYLMRDPEWVSAQHYAGARKLFNGEIGRWMDVIFIQSTYQGNGAALPTAEGYDATLAAAGAGAINLYRATMISDQAFGLADVLTVEMRQGLADKFGRRHELAWYAIFGAGILMDEYIYHIISA